MQDNHLSNDFLAKNIGQSVNLILEYGYHLKGIVKAFDATHILLETCGYSPFPQEYLQSRANISLMEEEKNYHQTTKISSDNDTTTSSISYVLLQQFLAKNCSKKITIFLNRGYRYEGTLIDFDNQHMAVSDSWGKVSLQALSAVGGLIATSNT